jgi:Cu(I)/Ag(I) efflux system membrane fusion protein
MIGRRFWLAIVVGGVLVAGCKGSDRTATQSDTHAAHGRMPSPAQSPQMAPASEAPMVHLDERQQVLAGVATAKAERRPLSVTIPAAGRVTMDESRLTRISAWVEGRIERLYVSKTGETVRGGQPVADLYSPDLLATQQELLVAVESAKALTDSPIAGVADNARHLVDASKQRLRLWGLSDRQIAEIIRRRQPLATVPVLSRTSGIVMKKMVQVGDTVDKGMTLFEIADLSRVWVEADVYEYELGGLRVGEPARVETLAYPGEVFAGRIAFISPMMMAETRTATVRIELANPGGRLKPEMYVTANLESQKGDRLVVPIGAVLDTGRRQVVWVQTAPGQFAQRDVVTGTRTDEAVEIVRGLQPGEVVAASGGYLIDATSQLERGAGGHGGHGGMAMPSGKP